MKKTIWNNIRAIGFLIALVAYIIFTGYQTFTTLGADGKVHLPVEYKDLVMLIASFYYVTRAVEDSKARKTEEPVAVRKVNNAHANSVQSTPAQANPVQDNKIQASA